MDTADDATLLRRAAAGEEAPCTILVRRYIRPATLLATQLLEDQDDAEDVVEQAFLIVLDRAGRFDPALGSFPAWLYGIVRRLATAHRRRDARRRALVALWPGAVPTPAHPSDAESILSIKETTRTVAGAVRRLPVMQRQLWQLSTDHDFAIADLAVLFGIAESTVRQHLFRARRTLRAALGDDA